MLEPAQTVALFQKSSDIKKFASGETIFEDGEYGNVMFGLIEGEVELFVQGKVVETIHKGDVFGEGALVHKEHTRASTAIAKTDCELAYIDEKHFLFAVQETPMFALSVIRSYSDRLRRLKRSL